MEFGKLHDLNGVDFTLPPDHPATGKLLHHSAVRKTEITFGGTGWSNKEWVGTWYPPGTKPRDFLAAYAKQFSNIELNTTHYRIPDPATIEQWYHAVPAHFRFFPKVPQVISHRKKLHGAERETLMFAAAVSGLGEKVGACFLQLPPTFGPDMMPRLRQFLSSWPDTLPLAVEFRHEAWFTRDARAEEGFDLLESFGAGTVITDVAGRRDVLHQRLTTPHLILRFVGNELHATDFSRWDDWAQRISEWNHRGLKSAAIFLHQPDNLRMPEFSLYAVPALQKATGISLSVPKKFDTAVQGSLF